MIDISNTRARVALLAASVAGIASAQSTDLKAFDGDWVFLEDRTEGRAPEQFNPPMNTKFIFKVEEGAIVLVWGHGGNGNRNVRVPIDGSNVDVPGEGGAFVRYRATFKDGLLAYEMSFARAAGQAPDAPRKREFRLTEDGLVVRSDLELTPGVWSVGLYRHPADIPMPAMAKATIGDLSWMVGAWIATRSTGSSVEERWTPAKGGAMLAVSRSVNRAGKMFAFEFIRIVERDGGLVYIAQPNGAPPTEFVMTELNGKRAVFENPRHDYPKRIVYEITPEGGLTATIGYTKGGTPGRFEFKRDGG